jgi:hypothetical protein
MFKLYFQNWALIIYKERENSKNASTDETIIQLLIGQEMI